MSLRRLVLPLLALAGCQCGEEPLVNVRAQLEVTPLMLDFGDVVVGDLRVLQLVVADVGSAGLTITTATIAQATREFSFGAEVPSMIAAQQRVDLGAVYEPTDLGVDTGTITFEANDERGPIVVTLRGRGVQSGAGVSLEGEGCGGMPASLAFGAVAPGTTVERRITVTSQGGAPLQVLSAVVEPGSSGEWAIDSSALPRTLAGGESLELIASYTPVDAGDDLGAFIITTDAASNPSIRVSACGSGIAPAICARPVPLDLGAVPDGDSRTGRLTIESCGLEPLVISAFALSTDPLHPSSTAFRLVSTPTVPITLMPGGTTVVEVAYDGRLPFGPAHAWVEATSNARSLPTAYFPVDARTASPCALSIAPGTINYRNVAVGQTAMRSAVVGNSGESACTVQSLAVTSTAGMGVFALATASMPFTLAPGEVQVVTVNYAPIAAGFDVGTLTVTDAAGGTLSATLLGNPPAPGGCAIDVTPSFAQFGITPVGTTAHLNVRAEAIGEDPCRITAATLISQVPAFAITLPAFRTALPGIGGVNIDVAFTPPSAMPWSDVLRVDYAATGTGMGSGTILVPISGLAGEARICVNPASIDFGTVAQGTTANRTVVIESCGAAPLNLRGALLAPRNGPFTLSQTPNLPQVLAAGANATPALTVTYAPTNAGPDFGQVELLSSDPTRPSVVVPLRGNFAGNCEQILDCAPTNVAFGDTTIGTNKIVRVVCRSLGPQPVTVTGVTLAGGTAEVGVSAQTPRVIQPGTAWSFDVRYAPQSTTTPINATISIVSNACVGTRTAAVTGRGVEPTPPPCLPPSQFVPLEQWSWHVTNTEPTFTNVWSTPMVANLDDDNMDGHIDENDVPDIAFISLDTYSITDPGASTPGILRVLSGDTGREKFAVTSPRFADTSIPAVGDIDGDGRPEIIGCKWVQTPMGMGMGGFFGRYITGTLVALDNTGRLLWESDPWQWPQEISFNAAAPAIADLDGDGFAEIILGRDVFDHNGRLRWRGTADYGLSSAGPHSVVADIDLDGHPEVIAGGTVYRADGSILFDIANIRDGGTAVGMLDPTDPYPQIVVHTGSGLTVLDHLGMERWHGAITSMGPATMLPVIADFDGDGDGDIAVADGEQMHVFNGTGGIIWSAPVSDDTCCAGIGAFDFEGDGPHELILTDNGTAYVYRGTDGTRIYRADRPNPTAFEMPVVADIDNDSKAELLVANFGPQGVGGIVAYSNVGDNWVGAPRIFNQQSYHVTNVHESGAIPRVETPLPQGPNVFRGTSATCR